MSWGAACPPPQDFGRVVQRVSAWVARGFYPGAGLILGSGEPLLLERYFGAFTAETEVFIASAGKWLAAAAIAAVVDQGLWRPLGLVQLFGVPLAFAEYFLGVDAW